jgi:hypothetical protein
VVFIGFFLLQVHLVPRELDDVGVVNVLSCHNFLPLGLPWRIRHGIHVELYTYPGMHKPVKINMSNSP